MTGFGVTVLFLLACVLSMRSLVQQAQVCKHGTDPAKCADCYREASGRLRFESRLWSGACAERTSAPSGQATHKPLKPEEER